MPKSSPFGGQVDDEDTDEGQQGKEQTYEDSMRAKHGLVARILQEGCRHHTANTKKDMLSSFVMSFVVTKDKTKLLGEMRPSLIRLGKVFS